MNFSGLIRRFSTEQSGEDKTHPHPQNVHPVPAQSAAAAAHPANNSTSSGGGGGGLFGGTSIFDSMKKTGLVTDISSKFDQIKRRASLEALGIVDKEAEPAPAAAPPSVAPGHTPTRPNVPTATPPTSQPTQYTQQQFKQTQPARQGNATGYNNPMDAGTNRFETTSTATGPGRPMGVSPGNNYYPNTTGQPQQYQPQYQAADSNSYPGSSQYTSQYSPYYGQERDHGASDAVSPPSSSHTSSRRDSQTDSTSATGTATGKRPRPPVPPPPRQGSLPRTASTELDTSTITARTAAQPATSSQAEPALFSPFSSSSSLSKHQQQQPPEQPGYRPTNPPIPPQQPPSRPAPPPPSTSGRGGDLDHLTRIECQKFVSAMDNLTMGSTSTDDRTATGRTQPQQPAGRPVNPAPVPPNYQQHPQPARATQNQHQNRHGEEDSSSASEYGDEGDKPVYDEDEQALNKKPIDRAGMDSGIRGERRLSTGSAESGTEDREDTDLRDFMRNFVDGIFDSNFHEADDSKSHFKQCLEHHSCRSWFARQVEQWAMRTHCLQESAFFRLLEYVTLVIVECEDQEDYVVLKDLLESSMRFFCQVTTNTNTKVNLQFYKFFQGLSVWQSLRFWNAAVFEDVQKMRFQIIPVHRDPNSIKTPAPHKDSPEVTVIRNHLSKMMQLSINKDLCMELIRKQGQAANLSSSDLQHLRAHVQQHPIY